MNKNNEVAITLLKDVEGAISIGKSVATDAFVVDLGGFTLTGIKRDGKPLREDDSVTVTCLATAGGMAPLLADESRAFEGGDTEVRDTWSAYVSGGNAALAEPENYIKLR